MQLSNYPGAKDNNQHSPTEHHYRSDKQTTSTLNGVKHEEKGDTKSPGKLDSDLATDSPDETRENCDKWNQPDNRVNFLLDLIIN